MSCPLPHYANKLHASLQSFVIARQYFSPLPVTLLPSLTSLQIQGSILLSIHSTTFTISQVLSYCLCNIKTVSSNATTLDFSSLMVTLDGYGVLKEGTFVCPVDG